MTASRARHYYDLLRHAGRWLRSARFSYARTGADRAGVAGSPSLTGQGLFVISSKLQLRECDVVAFGEALVPGYPRRRFSTLMRLAPCPPGLRFWGTAASRSLCVRRSGYCGSALPSTSRPVAALLPAKSDRVGKPSPMPFLTSLLRSPHSISQLCHRDSFCDSPRRHHDSFADVTIGSLSLGSDADRRYSTGPEPPGRLFTRDI
jgi:hypothetical protein